MTDEMPPEWAIKRALEVMECVLATVADVVADPDGWAFVLNVARYIMQHEQPPVDALLEEARKLATAYCDRLGYSVTRDAIEQGRRDDGPEMLFALATLRRGIELAEKGQ